MIARCTIFHFIIIVTIIINYLTVSLSLDWIVLAMPSIDYRLMADGDSSSSNNNYYIIHTPSCSAGVEL